MIFYLPWEQQVVKRNRTAQDRVSKLLPRNVYYPLYKMKYTYLYCILNKDMHGVAHTGTDYALVQVGSMNVPSAATLFPPIPR
jgi:hypothetical protein